MKAAFIFILLSLNTKLLPGQENKEETYGRQIGKMLEKSDVSSYTMKYFTDVAKYTFNKTSPGDDWESKYQAAIQKANNNAERFSADFQKIIAKNKESADKERIVFKTVEYSGRVIMSPIESIPIWGPIQKEINNQIFKVAEDELN